VARIPEVIARDRRFQFIVDSLTAAGHAHAEAEEHARHLPDAPVDTSSGAAIWQDVLAAGVTVFVFSPGGDRVQSIAWSARDRRFYQLVECC
jgi:hypothetical protein